MPPERLSLRSGTVLARFRVERRLGTGATGEVYKAADLELERPVALKILSGSGTARDASPSEPTVVPDTGSAIQKQMLREARLASSLTHPSIVTIYSIERVEDIGFIVMEYVEGRTLQELLGEGPIPLERVLEIGADVADALSCAHEIGLIHRDIKPANLMVAHNGRVKVLDFGLAKSLVPGRGDRASTESTRTEATSLNTIKGTIPYMSPEQTRAEPLDGRSDLFSLGSVLYECATGRRPFGGTELYSMLRAIQTEDPVPPSRVRPGIDFEFDRILAIAMAKDRAHRFATGGELALALRSLREGKALALEPALPVIPETGDHEPHNLPLQLTSFVGRDREVAAVKHRFGSSRLITLTGAGGCGKTRLAIRIARSLLGECVDGVWFVDLAPLSDPSLVADEVAAALSIREEAGKSLLDTLTDHLVGKSLLLVVDNCEHLVAAAAALTSHLLYHCPRIRILATSREALHVPGEFVYRTPSLSVPPAGGNEPWHVISRYESIQLFYARAEAAGAALRPVEQGVTAVAELCRQLDGIPLAIELAAGRAAALSPEEILLRVKDQLRLLEGRGTGSQRQQTLRATIDWSYDLLAENERVLFRRLGVFAGSFALGGAESVCAGNGIQSEDVLPLVVRLFEQSLLYPEEDATGEGRYRVPETLRAYARERLRESQEQAEVWRRHREHFLGLAESAEAELQGPDQARWFHRLGAAYEDIRVAIRACLDQEDEATAGRFCAALRRFWWVRGMWSEGRARIGDVLDLDSHRRDRSVDSDGVVPASIRIKMLHGGAVLARGQGAYDEAEALLHRGLDLARQESDSRSTAMILHELANIRNEHGDLKKARSLYDQSLAIWRSLGDKRGMSAVLHNLGVVAQSQKDYRAARRLYQESLEIQRELGNRAWEAAGLNGLGSVAAACAEWETARTCHEQALAIQKELEDRWGMAFSLRGLGTVAERTGELKRARELLRESLKTLRDLGDREGISESLESLVALAIAESRPERAIRLAGAALALRDAIGSPLMPSDRDRMDAQLEHARQLVGAQAASQALLEGRTLALEQAIRYGLE